MSGGWTKGPWKADTNLGCKRISAKPRTLQQQHKQAKRTEIASTPGLYDEAEDLANARLIASAPDHADIGWAMCVAAGRWEPWGDGRGEFCLNGLRFVTKLDTFGIPEVTPQLREQVAKARGEQ